MSSAAQDEIVAIVVDEFGSADQLRLGSTRLPPLGANDVHVAVDAASVTPLDTYLRAGVKVGGYSPKLPYVPGGAFAGRVLEAGSASGRRVGERVFGQARSGAYAMEAICDAARIFSLPDGITAASGALVAVPYRTAYHSLFDLGRATEGETVLVQGAAGSVGAAAVQIARAHGLHVIGTCAPRNAAQASADGAHAVVDHRREDWPAAVREAAAGRPITVVIEVAARANLARDLDLAAPGGRIVIVGGHGETTIDPLPIIGKGLSLYGVSLPGIPPARDADIMAAIVTGLRDGTLRPRCAQTFPLAEAAAAHAAIEAGQGAGGIALLTAP